LNYILPLQVDAKVHLEINFLRVTREVAWQPKAGHFVTRVFALPCYSSDHEISDLLYEGTLMVCWCYVQHIYDLTVVTQK